MRTIEINGSIVDDDYGAMYDRYGIEATYPKKVKSQLAEAEADGDDVEININSGGGDVFAGFEIYTAILGYKGNVRINVTGIAASAASVIMCAADCRISPVGMVMVHCSSCYAGAGDHKYLEKMADMLKNIDESIASAYVTKTGMSKGKAVELMNDTTWLTAEKAVELGLCDGYIAKINTSGKKPEGTPTDNKLKNDKAAAAKAKARFLMMRGEMQNV